MSGLTIRPFVPSDADTLGQVFYTSVHHGAVRFYDEEQRSAWCPAPPSGDAWLARLRPLECVVAEVRDTIVGFMCFEPETGYIDFTYMLPAAMGKGIADALYAVCEGRLRTRGMDRLTVQASELAKSFFLRHGWNIVTRQEIERDGIVLHNYRMEKLLVRKLVA